MERSPIAASNLNVVSSPSSGTICQNYGMIQHYLLNLTDRIDCIMGELPSYMYVPLFRMLTAWVFCPQVSRMDGGGFVKVKMNCSSTDT